MLLIEKFIHHISTYYPLSENALKAVKESFKEIVFPKTNTW